MRLPKISGSGGWRQRPAGANLRRVIHFSSIPAAGDSRRPAGFQIPCVTELDRRWDPVQGREVFVSPSPVSGTVAQGRVAGAGRGARKG